MASSPRSTARIMAAPLLLAAGALAASLPANGVRADVAEKRVAVRVMVPHLTPTAPGIALSGQVEPRVQSNVSFRIDGKVIERRVEVGQHVQKDQLLAVLDPAEQKADVDNAEAGLTSVEALLQQAQTTYDRQATLLSSGYTTRAAFDNAQATLKTTQAQVDVARAAVSTVKEQLSYTELKAATAGIIVSRSVEAGQVVQTGQTVFVLAEDGPRDAVFDIFESLLTKPPNNKTVEVFLQADPAVRAQGVVREISPTIDPATSTVKVKIGLEETPPQMTLGAAVVGVGRWDEKPTVVLPWDALFECDGKTAVWIVDASDAVACKSVEVASYTTGSVILAGGLDGTERVVTAGSQFLHPGQKVVAQSGAQP